MQNRTSILSFLVVAAGTAALLATTANSQLGAPKAQVSLQPTTPGTSQSGHSNVSGSSRAGQFVGGGAGLTGVNADLLNGLNSTAFLQSVPVPLTLTGTSASSIISAENTSASSLSSAFFGRSTAGTGTTYGVCGQSDSTFGRGVYGLATATSGAANGGWFQTASENGNGVVGQATDGDGENYGVVGESLSTSGVGVYGKTPASSGGTYGVYGLSNSTTGYGVYGKSSAMSGNSQGGHFESASTSGFGVVGYNSALSGTTYGGFFQSAGPEGRGVYGEGNDTGVYGVGDSTGVRGIGYDGVKGEANGFFGYGLWGIASSTSGRGVNGYASAATGETYGLYGQSNSTDGRGVYGLASAVAGATYGVIGHSASTSGRGVYGIATGASGITYGVYGQALSAGGWAVYASGNMGASGVKPFRIDHPFDPENKYLLHFSSESPMPQNFYVGNVKTDSKGYAWVDLPDYFSEINANFKYQLTVVDESDSNEFIWVKVVQKIKGNQFRIRTNLPNIEVSWEVKADRNDLYVRNRPPKDVVDKQDLEKGTYQHPEFYGMPKERGMNFRPADAGKLRAGNK